MDRFQTVWCSREQAGVLMRNVWRTLQVRGSWVCVREPNVWISVTPGPEEYCQATIEILDQRPERFQEADEECRAIVENLFTDILNRQ
jgi:hypothetical protein